MRDTLAKTFALVCSAARSIKVACLAMAVILAATSPAAAQEKLAPERASATRTGWWFYWGVTPQSLGATLDRTKSRIVDLEVNSASPLTLSATLVENSGSYASGWWWYVDQTSDQLGKLLQQNNGRLTSLSAYRVNGQLRFAAVMVSNTGANASGWWWYFDQTADQVGRLLDQNKARLVDVQAYASGNQTLYAVVMVSNQGPKATGWWWYLGQTPDQIGKLLDANHARILRLRRSPGGGETFDVIMVPNTGAGSVGWWWYSGVSPEKLVELTGRYNARLFDVTSPDGGASYAGVMIDNGMPLAGDCGGQMAGVDRVVSQWMKSYAIPGAAVAVVKSDRLVYACGFGLADIAEGRYVQPLDRFRIASISKMMTRSAVRNLVAEGKLSLSDKMLDRLGSAKPAEPYADTRLADITIDHLMEHQGGWNTAKLGFDPMNYSDQVAAALGTQRPSTCRDNIRYMFQKQMLNYPPGSPLMGDIPGSDGDKWENHNYSNLGYCILGRIVDNASGQSYEAYVKQAVLSPIGITSMQIGHSLIGGRAPNEVHYYDAPLAGDVNTIFPSPAKAPAPYGVYNVETGDSAGGWIASAPDIARFATLAAPQPYDGDWGFNGGLIGTSTTVSRSGDTVVVVLFNGNFPEKDANKNPINFGQLVDAIKASVAVWPPTDLWSKYGYRSPGAAFRTLGAAVAAPPPVAGAAAPGESVDVKLDVDLYAQPGGAGDPIGTLSTEDKGVVLLEPCRDNWCHVQWPGHAGWVYSGPDYNSLGR